MAQLDLNTTSLSVSVGLYKGGIKSIATLCERLAQLEANEALTRRVAPTDSGQVRANELAEAKNLRDLLSAVATALICGYEAALNGQPDDGKGVSRASENLGFTPEVFEWAFEFNDTDAAPSSDDIQRAERAFGC